MSMGKFHFTKSTVQANCWCNRCNKETPWRISGGKRAYCIPCYEKSGKVVPKFVAAHPPESDPQGDLFK